MRKTVAIAVLCLLALTLSVSTACAADAHVGILWTTDAFGKPKDSSREYQRGVSRAIQGP
ncbi:MAG: hypothetical protein ACUVTL_10355 [Thermoproteota archaeon]